MASAKLNKADWLQLDDQIRKVASKRCRAWYETQAITGNCPYGRWGLRRWWWYRKWNRFYQQKVKELENAR